MIEWKTTYLSLGSNVGDREANLRKAIDLLRAPRLVLKRVSPVYETDPLDVKDQGKFLNLVVEIETDLFPMMLLSHVQRIEKALGRQRLIDKGPRTIDIDILLYAKSIIHSPKLAVPHPRMHERRFVLEPMVELAPELRHPVIKRTMAELRKSTLDQALRRTDIRICAAPA
jgi:2-amino-4-hydroxy-6-hydroxymethyldihydropteridine diphosphokinase